MGQSEQSVAAIESKWSGFRTKWNQGKVDSEEVREDSGDTTRYIHDTFLLLLLGLSYDAGAGVLRFAMPCH